MSNNKGIPHEMFLVPENCDVHVKLMSEGSSIPPDASEPCSGDQDRVRKQEERLCQVIDTLSTCVD